VLNVAQIVLNCANIYSETKIALQIRIGGIIMSLTQIKQDQAFSTVIRERHSVRNYDPTFKISQEEMKELLGDATLAPSSSNVQPWRFLVIDSQPLKEKLHPIAYSQKQVLDASAVIVVLGDLEGYKLADKIFSPSVELGHMTEEAKNAMVERTVGLYSSLPQEVLRKIVYTDGGLISMQLMLAAKARGYDTVPMGGYDAAKLVEAFGISERYVPIMLIAVGKGIENASERQSSRLTVDEVASFNEISF
jgi:nitroreductase